MQPIMKCFQAEQAVNRSPAPAPSALSLPVLSQALTPPPCSAPPPSRRDLASPTPGCQPNRRRYRIDEHRILLALPFELQQIYARGDPAFRRHNQPSALP